MVVAARNPSIEAKRKPLPSKAAPSTSGNAGASKPFRPPPKKLDKKEGKNGFFGCCKPKKKQQNGVKKAAPPKGKFNSLFGGKKKSTQATNKSRPSTSLSKHSTQKNNAPRPFGQNKQPSLRPTPTQVKQPSFGAAPQNSKSKSKEKSERNVKKAASTPVAHPTKIQIKKSGAGTESTRSREREMKTGVEASVKEFKKPKTFLRPKGGEEGEQLQGCQNYEEVKVSVADLGNGLVERKMILKSVYPQDQPPKPYVSSVVYPQKKKSYTCLKQANSFERVFSVAQHLNGFAAAANNASSCSLVQLPNYLSFHNPDLSPLSTPSQNRRRVDRALSKSVKPRDDAQFVDSALKTKLALQDVQQSLRNLNILTVKKLLPDSFMSAYNEKMSAVIHELDHFINSTHHPASSDPSSNFKW